MMLGAEESTYLEDFLKEIEADEESNESGVENNITDLREWANYVNRAMTGGESTRA
jgi:hypothetical protein